MIRVQSSNRQPVTVRLFSDGFLTLAVAKQYHALLTPAEARRVARALEKAAERAQRRRS